MELTGCEAHQLCELGIQEGCIDPGQAAEAFSSIESNPGAVMDGEWLVARGVVNSEMLVKLRQAFQDRASTTSTFFMAEGPSKPPVVVNNYVDVQLPPQVGRYRIESKLGAGAMGVVYRALDTMLEVPVALKVLPPEAASDPLLRKRLLTEARNAALLRDTRHVAAVYEAGIVDGVAFVAMELVEGATLEEWMKMDRPPANHAREAVGIACAIADGLAVAHARGLVHRDLKPANVMVTPAGAVKILDFGVSKNLRRVPNAETMTELAGTPIYMAPEVLAMTLGLEPVDPAMASAPRVDIYAFGLTIAEILSRSNPFWGSKTFGELLTRKRDGMLLDRFCWGVGGHGGTRNRERFAPLLREMVAPGAFVRPSDGSAVLDRWRQVQSEWDLVGSRHELGEGHPLSQEGPPIPGAARPSFGAVTTLISSVFAAIKSVPDIIGSVLAVIGLVVAMKAQETPALWALVAVIAAIEVAILAMIVVRRRAARIEKKKSSAVPVLERSAKRADSEMLCLGGSTDQRSRKVDHTEEEVLVALPGPSGRKVRLDETGHFGTLLAPPGARLAPREIETRGFHEEYWFGARRIRLYQGDLSELDVEAWVSSDNNQVAMAGGVSAAILDRAGLEVQLEARQQLPAAQGQVLVTRSSRLGGRIVLHALTIGTVQVGDLWTAIPPTLETITTCTRGVIQKLRELAPASVAIPPLGAGAGKLDQVKVARVICTELVQALTDPSFPVEDVVFAYTTGSADFIEAFRAVILDVAPAEVGIRRPA